MDENNHAVDDADPLANLLTIAEVEEMLRVNRATIEGWFAAGALPHYRLGPKTIRIARADLEEFLASRRLTRTPPGSRFDKKKPAAPEIPEIPENIRSKHSSPADSDSRTAAA
jgi:excisionase family DNA binding protein